MHQKVLKNIKDKIHQYKPKQVQNLMGKGGKQTEELFNRRLSVLPANVKKKLQINGLNGSSSCMDLIKKNQEALRQGKKIENLFKSPAANPLQLIKKNVATSSVNKREEVADREELDAVVKIQPESNYNEPLIYGIVFNLAFAIVRQGNERKVLFKCNIPGCIFRVMNDKEIKQHFEAVHEGKSWNGFCGKCSKMNFYPGTTMTVFDELKHVKEHTASVVGNEKVQINRGKVLNDKLLLNIESFCSAIESLNLQPWLENSEQKSKPAAVSMLHENPLLALFKCMQKDCIFFTSDSSLFFRHLTYHGAKSHACSYCAFKGSAVDGIIKHIQENHSNDCFQCAFCFYRSLTKNNLMTHSKQYHSDKQNVVIIECYREGNKKIRAKLQQEARSHAYVFKFIHPFKCMCGKEFYTFGSFEKHIKVGHAGLLMKKECTKCKEMLYLKDLIEHTEKCMKLSHYQCLHCLYGVKDVQSIFEHVANEHPSQFPIYCDRLDVIGSVS